MIYVFVCTWAPRKKEKEKTAKLLGHYETVAWCTAPHHHHRTLLHLVFFVLNKSKMCWRRPTTLTFLNVWPLVAGRMDWKTFITHAALSLSQVGVDSGHPNLCVRSFGTWTIPWSWFTLDFYTIYLSPFCSIIHTECFVSWKHRPTGERKSLYSGEITRVPLKFSLIFSVVDLPQVRPPCFPLLIVYRNFSIFV